MPIWSNPAQKTRKLNVLLFDKFSNNCLANAIEPFRAANAISGQSLYQWKYVTLDGAPIQSSSGLRIIPDGALSHAEPGYAVVVLCSYDFVLHSTPASFAALRAAATRHDVMIAMDAGSWLLASAGLLDGRKATIHWEEHTHFAETFPDVTTFRDRYVIDGNRITCTGAMAAYDLSSHLVAEHHGEALRLEVGLMLMHDGSSSQLAFPLPQARSDAVKRTIKVMLENQETPLPISKLASKTGLSQRRLQDLFSQEFGTTPSVVYRRIRLATARHLATDGSLTIGEIACRCGYANVSAMIRAFVAEFGIPPGKLRREGHPDNRSDRGIKSNSSL
ncbi:GlxA family transcriptional regulator [Roseibium sp.]|uniref:GlxA family transcriptional regulator n=1 Tax=Roseibium sp. TaxID=1936156 RepID=UPI003B521FDB